MGMEQYRIETHPLCAPDAVIRGERYRICVLTDRLIRLEYAEDGQFEDRPTQTVLNRNFPAVAYRLYEKNGKLELFTKWLHLTYDMGEFSENGLKINIIGRPDGCPGWRYGQKLNDLKGTRRTLDTVNGEATLDPGIVSREGFTILDDSKTMLLTEDGWIEPRKGNKTDLYFFGYGHDYKQCLKDFYFLCGSQPLIPRYALGNWWSRYHRYTEQEYLALMERFEKENIPISVAVLDMDWHLLDDVDPKYGSGWTGYIWNRKFFPDPKGFLEKLHEKGYHVALCDHPADGIRAFEEMYPETAAAMGVDPATEEPVDFNAADPHFLQVFFEKVHHPLEEDGVDLWWLDWQQGNNTDIPGLDPLWILNHYYYLDSARRGKRPMTFSRYAGPGSHRYPIGFSGDTWITWESLKFQPYFTVTASNIGFGWWSHDIGGHMFGRKDGELLARWIQFGAFSPILRLHSSSNPLMHKEPWKYEGVERDTMEQYLRLRHAMLPYLYTMNKLANRDGMPLLRPMYYDEPNHLCLYRNELRNQYYFGTEMMVAPITDPVNPVAQLAMTKAWIPAGLWFDFFSGMAYSGGRILDLYRPLQDMPVLVKAGGIVPLQKQRSGIRDVSNPAGFDIHVFPGADGEFTIWEDRDEAVDREENWAETTLRLVNGDAKSVFVIHEARGNLNAIPEKRSYTLRFRSVERTEAVIEGAEAEVSYCEDEKTLLMEIPETPVTQTIQVVFPKGLQRTANPILRYAEERINRAEISYNEKCWAYEAIGRDGVNAIGAVSSFIEDPVLKGALIEVLTADTEEKRNV